MKKPQLKFGEIIRLGFQLVKERPGLYILLCLMFFFPAALVQEFQLWQLPTDFSGMELKDAAQLILPTFLWAVGLSFFTLIAELCVNVYIMRTKFALEEESFGEDLDGTDFLTVLTLGMKSFFRAAVTLFLMYGFLMLLIYSMGFVLTLSTGVALVALLAFGLVLTFYGMYRYGAVAMSVRVEGVGLRIALGSQQIQKENLWKSLAYFLGFMAITTVPKFLISLGCSYLIGLLPHTLWTVLLASALDTIVGFLDLLLVTFTGIRVHEALYNSFDSKREDMV